MDAVSKDVAIIGSKILVGVEFAPVDNLYSLKYLYKNNRLSVQYYIADSSKYTDVSTKLFDPDDNDDNLMGFMVDTSDLKEGVLMVQVTASIPTHDGLPERTEIARCSSRITIIK